MFDRSIQRINISRLGQKILLVDTISNNQCYIFKMNTDTDDNIFMIYDIFIADIIFDIVDLIVYNMYIVLMLTDY